MHLLYEINNENHSHFVLLVPWYPPKLEQTGAQGPEKIKNYNWNNGGGTCWFSENEVQEVMKRQALVDRGLLEAWGTGARQAGGRVRAR